MKNFTKQLLLLFISLHITTSLKPVSSSSALDADILTTVMDEGTGAYYTGTALSTSNLTLAKFTPVTGSTSPSAATVHVDALGRPFKYLTVSAIGTTTVPARIVAATYDDAGGIYNRIIVTNETIYTKTDIINDVAGDTTTYIPDTSSYVSDGSDDGEILALAADSTRVFAAVRRASGDWLTPGSGINSYTIDTTTLELTQKDQQTMDSQDFLVGSNSNGVDDAHEDNVIIRYDSDLTMVYAANYWTRANSASNDGVHSIAAYSVNTSTGVLTATNLHGASNTASSTGWGDASSDANKHIVGVVGGGSATLRTLAVHAFDIMTTSSSEKYMIVAGGNGTNATTGNTVWALPLVTAGQVNAGTLADTTGTNLNTQAADATKLYNAGSTPAKVGNGVLPWAATVIPSAMQVIGDTVYIATDDNTGSFAAIYYSHAIFDTNNMIASWTPWKKAGPKELGTSTTDGSVINFAVNPITAKIWSVPEDSDTVTGGLQSRVVRTTAWADLAARKRTRAAATQTETVEDSFTGSHRLSSALTITEHNLPEHFTLYGGTLTNGAEGVVFVRNGETDSTSSSSNVKATTVTGAPRILSVGISAWNNGAEEVMIPCAGTQDGLYAFIHPTTKVGGDPRTSGAGGNCHDLNDGFWSTGAWERIHTDTIKGNVVSIYSKGNSLYVHTRGIGTQSIKDTIHRLDKADVTTNTIPSATLVKVAESNTHGLPEQLLHSGVITSGDGTVEQVSIGTGDGIFNSVVSGGIQSIAETSVESSSWSVIPETTGKAHIQVSTEGNQLSTVSLETTSNVTSTTFKILHDDNGIPTTEVHLENDLGTISEETIESSSGITSWNDGARELFIESGHLTARKLGTTTPTTIITTEENNAFGPSVPKNISLTASGVLQIATDSSTIELK